MSQFDPWRPSLNPPPITVELVDTHLGQPLIEVIALAGSEYAIRLAVQPEMGMQTFVFRLTEPVAERLFWRLAAALAGPATDVLDG